MKSKNKILSVFLVCLIFLAVPFLLNLIMICDNFYFFERGSEDKFNRDSLKNSYLYTFTEIEIDDTNPSMDWAFTAATHAWCSGGPGDTPANAYYIEDTLFTPSLYDNAITIRNSVVYFRIKDCGIEDVWGNFEECAIELDNVSNGRILDCDFIDNKYDVHLLNSHENWLSGNFFSNAREIHINLENSNDCVIFNNTITSTLENDGIRIFGDNNLISENKIDYSYDHGIYLSGDNNQIIMNTVMYSGDDGIELYDCNNNTISDNIVIDNYLDGIRIGYGFSNHINNNIASYNRRAGIKLYGTSDSFNNVTENIVEFNTYGIDISYWSQYNNINFNNISNNAFCGIYIDNVENNNITDNNIIKCGVIINGDPNLLANNIISDTNLVNGKKLYCYNSTKNLSNSDFINAGQVILIKCNDSQVSNLDLGFSTIGLFLMSCRNVKFSNILSNNNTLYGIYLDNCDLCTIEDSEANYNGKGGLIMRNSDNCTLQSNEANGNYIASFTYVYYVYSYTFGNGDGIYAHGSFNNSIKGNTASYNSEYGIEVPAGINHEISTNTADYNNDTGIFLTSLYNAEIFSNIISGNRINGLHLSNCENNKIYENTAQNHLDQGFVKEHNGIFLTDSIDNEVYGNTLLNYTRGVHLYSYSENNTIFANEFSYCIAGIMVSYNSHRNQLNYNTINSNFGGIELDGISNTTIDSNIITNSFSASIKLRDNSDYNLIINNSIKGVGNLGIELHDSSYNLIKENTITQKYKCFEESGNCIGNIFEDNVCREVTGAPPIGGYELYIIFSILGISLIILLKKHGKIKI